MSSYRSAKNLCTRANRINAIIYVIILSKRLILNIFSSKPIINEYKTANIPQAGLGCIFIINNLPQKKPKIIGIIYYHSNLFQI